MAVYDALRSEIETTAELCARSGILAAIAAQMSTTPEAPEPVDEVEGEVNALG